MFQLIFLLTHIHKKSASILNVHCKILGLAQPTNQTNNRRLRNMNIHQSTPRGAKAPCMPSEKFIKT